MKTLKQFLFVLIILSFTTLSFAAKKQTCEIPPSMKELAKDLAGNSALESEFKKSSPDKIESLGEAWVLLKETGYNQKRKDVTNITNVAKLLSNSKLSSSGLDYEKIKNLIEGNRGQGASELDKITAALNTLVSSGTKFSNINRLTSDLKKGGNFGVGARWTLRYIYENTGEFSNKNLKFEENINGNRRVDLVVKKAGGDLHYEFKSDRNSPPPRFAEEFVKDLQNVDDLNQIKWIFDRDKVSSLNKQAFLDKLRDASGQIPQSLINKFAKDDPKSLEGLIDSIDNKFNQIFQVK